MVPTPTPTLGLPLCLTLRGLPYPCKALRAPEVSRRLLEGHAPVVHEHRAEFVLEGIHVT